MDAFRIVGGQPLRGNVQVSGAKNASLPIMAASLLAAGTSRLRRAPDLADVRTLGQVLAHMGVRVERERGSSVQPGADAAAASPAGEDTLVLDATHLTGHEAPYELVRTMRASILVLGPLLARLGEAKVSLPGGCAIGSRPIDQHLKGLVRLGADITLRHGYVHAKAPPGGLVGNRVVFDMPTVTGTENVLLAACLARGTSELQNAAQEPEITDLGHALQAMGAQIEGLGTSRLVVHGQATLRPYDHRVVADRIECGTLLVAGAMAGDPLVVRGGVSAHQDALIECLRAVGADIALHDNGDMVVRRAPRPKACDVHTAPYPGMATDMQAQLMALLACADGVSLMAETIFENRFMHVAELDRMGANIRVEGSKALVHGVAGLSGATVMATDLRASACLVLAGLVADGETLVRRIYHLDRGYEALENKLSRLGANIVRVREGDRAGAGAGA